MIPQAQGFTHNSQIYVYTCITSPTHFIKIISFPRRCCHEPLEWLSFYWAKSIVSSGVAVGECFKVFCVVFDWKTPSASKHSPHDFSTFQLKPTSQLDDSIFSDIVIFTLCHFFSIHLKIVDKLSWYYILINVVFHSSWIDRSSHLLSKGVRLA